MDDFDPGLDVEPGLDFGLEEDPEMGFGEDNDEELDEDFGEESEVIPEGERTIPAVKIKRTLPVLSKYEKARVLGVRAHQLSSGLTPNVPIKGSFNPLLLALQELNEGLIPLIVRRYLPDGSKEEWAVSDLRV